MPGKRWIPLATAVSVAAVVFGSTARAADEVSGLITRTYMIVEDTELTGDVVCNVADNTPCFGFGAPDVELRLNGFTITGKADARTACAGVLIGGENGISTNSRSNVGVRGPGLLQRFRTHGVAVLASTNARVQDVTTSTNCGSGVFIAATSFGTLVEGVVSVRNGSTAPGASCGGIWIAGHNSRVRLNATHGNGYSEPADDFGIGVIGTATGNTVDQNNVTGNTNGIFIGSGTRQTMIRQNIVLGNPGIQVANTRPDVQAVDILNLSPAGQSSFERNTCITSVNAPCPIIQPRQREP